MTYTPSAASDSPRTATVTRPNGFIAKIPVSVVLRSLIASNCGYGTERWKKIAVSAAKQSGRTRLPKVHRLCEFREFVKHPWDDALKLFFWEREGQQTLKQVHDRQPDAQAVLLAIGPEGGFSAEEADMAQRHGFTSVQLGPRILRAETAALTALSLVQFLWGDLG